MNRLSRSMRLLPVLAVLYVLVLNLILIRPAAAYLTPSKWSSRSIGYRISSFTVNGQFAPFPADVASRADTAVTKWSKASTGKNFSFFRWTSAGPAQVEVGRASFSAKGWPAYPGLTPVVSSGGFNTVATSYLNSDFSWNNTCTQSESLKKVDTLVVALHEVGHTVSLDHDPWHKEAVMWPDYTCKTSLKTDDLNGIGFLYP